MNTQRLAHLVRGAAVVASLGLLANLAVMVTGTGGMAGGVAAVGLSGVALLGMLVLMLRGLRPTLGTGVSSEVLLQKDENLHSETEPALAEAQLTVGYLNSALELTSDGCLRIDADGNCTPVARRFAEMLGYKAEDLTGKHWDAIVAESSRGPVSDALGLALRTGAASIEAMLRRKDGSSSPCRLHLLAISDSQERHGGYLWVSQPTHASLHQLNDAKAEAERANRAKTEFLARVGHEVRTPLNALVAVTDLLAETHLDESQRQYLDVLRTGSQQLLDLASDMLELSKVESGGLAIEYSDFDLQMLLDDVTRASAPFTNQKELRLASSVQPNVATALNGDGQRIRQVLLELLRYAAKFTERGTINLRVTACVDEADTNPARPMVRFDVIDPGPGMPADELNKLVSYIKETREGGARGPVLAGQGLGLTLSKRLAEAMGGRLAVSSRSYPGTTLSLLIPMRPASERPAAPESVAGERVVQPQRGPLSGVKLLLVATGEAERKSLSDELTQAGCRVSAADGAMPALLSLARAVELGDPFRLVVIDGRLCRVTGVETAQRLAAQEWAANPGIVILTAGLTEDDLEGHEQVRARLYSGNPMDASSLLPELAEALASAGQPATARREQVPARARRVLVVDDNSTNLFLVKDFLKKVPGIEVEAVDGGEVAVDCATGSRFDLILMDMQMPVVDGRTATRRIRQYEREQGLPEVPIIAFTAHSLETELAEATAAGCNGHLIKPAKKQKVIDTVLSYLNAAASSSTGSERETNPSRPSALPIVALGQEQFRDHTGDYLTRLAESLTRAEAALKEHDFSAVKEISHKWIGPGVGLGLPEISDEGGLLQNAARTSNELLVQAQLSRIRDYTTRLQVVFEDGATVRPACVVK